MTPHVALFLSALVSVAAGIGIIIAAGNSAEARMSLAADNQQKRIFWDCLTLAIFGVMVIAVYEIWRHTA